MTASRTLSNTAAAVLGMVNLGARSGYQIGRAVERSVRFFWALGPPQVYAELKRLEADGLLEGHDDARGHRARRVFTPTAAGRAALERWLEQDDEQPLELRDAELLRLFFADATEPQVAHARIDAIRARSRRAIEHFDRAILPAAHRTRTDAQAQYPEHVARFGRELHEFIIAWCDRLDNELGVDRQR